MKKMRLMYFYKRPFMKVTHTVLRWCSQGRHTPTDCTRSTLSSHHSFHIHIGAHITASSAKSVPYLPLYKTVILSALAREILQFSTNPWSRSHQFRELSSYPGYFRKPHWKSMRLLDISRVTCQVWSIMMAVLWAIIQVSSTPICMVQCTHLIITGRTPHLYNRGSSMLVNSLHSGENNM